MSSGRFTPEKTGGGEREDEGRGSGLMGRKTLGSSEKTDVVARGRETDRRSYVKSTVEDVLRKGLELTQILHRDGTRGS